MRTDDECRQPVLQVTRLHQKEDVGIKIFFIIIRTSAAAAAQMRSVYNPAGMPGSGGHYGVMGRAQDHRGSMFGSSLNLNGK